MVLPWRTLIFAHTEECRPWRTLIFAHMILSCSGDSEQSQANYRNSLSSRCQLQSQSRTNLRSMWYFEFFVQGFTRVLTHRAAKQIAILPRMSFDFLHIRHYRGEVICPKSESTEKDSVPLLDCWTDKDDHFERMIDDSGRGESRRARLPRSRHRDRRGPASPEEDGARRGAMLTRRAAQTFWDSRSRERAGHAIHQSRESAAAVR